MSCPLLVAAAVLLAQWGSALGYRGSQFFPATFKSLSLHFVGSEPRALAVALVETSSSLVVVDAVAKRNVTVAATAASVVATVTKQRKELLLLWRDANATCFATLCSAELVCYPVPQMTHPCNAVVAAVRVDRDGAAAWFAWRRDGDGGARLLFYSCTPSTDGRVCDTPRAPLSLRSRNADVLALLPVGSGGSNEPQALRSLASVLPQFDVFDDNGTVAFVPLRDGVVGVRLAAGAAGLAVFAAANMSAAGGASALRAVRAASDGLPVMLFATAERALYLATCPTVSCSANTSVSLVARQVDDAAATSLVAASDGAIIAGWITNRALLWLRCRDPEPCTPRAIVLRQNETGVEGAAIVESPTPGIAALVYVERNRVSGLAALRLRQCANATCERFVGDFLGAPVPTGFLYASAVVIAVIFACLVLCAIPACVVSKKHHIS